MLRRREEEPNLKFGTRIKLFLDAHWKGVLTVLVPLIALPLVLPHPAKEWQWCAYCLIIMAIFWVSENLPLAVTAFMPCLIFPFSGVATSDTVCSNYMNDSVMMFLGSLMLACSVEQSGLHERLAYFTIRSIGYSHFKLLFALFFVTTFISLWITNTAATTMMVPINLALLKLFEKEGLLKFHDIAPDGTKIASQITLCYFSGISYSATNGGIGTLVGTGTNLVFKSLFHATYDKAPELLSFPKFCAFAVPVTIAIEVCTYFYLAYVYLGMFRPKSKVALSAKISEKGKEAARRTITESQKKLGSITYWEWMVIFLFGGAVVAFFCRSPQIFQGWGDVISAHFDKPPKFVKDSSLAMFVSFLMFMLPCRPIILQNFTAKSYEDLPKGPVPGVISWKKMNAELPWAFMFLLGGGTALARGAGTSGLNDKLGEYMHALTVLSNEVILLLVIILTVFVTNFASNVAVCNVIAPIAMTLAKTINQNPFYYVMAAGIGASFCFMIPVGTPGNLIVQSAAQITTGQMMKAGIGSTISSIVFLWLFLLFWGPVIWPVLHEPQPVWVN